MLKIFKESILRETLMMLQKKYKLNTSDEWKKKGSSYSTSIYEDNNIGLYIYFGIRFVEGRNYIIPYIRISSKEMKLANESENNLNVYLNKNLSWVNFDDAGIILYKCNFDDYINTSSEIMKPTEELITSILSNEGSFNCDGAKQYGVTKLNFLPEMIRTWDLFEEIFFVDSIADQQVHKIINPVLEDIDRVLCEYYIPFMKKVISHSDNLR